jgi:hypothetical protein
MEGRESAAALPSTIFGRPLGAQMLDRRAVTEVRLWRTRSALRPPTARKGWQDLAATIRNPMPEAWDFLTRTPMAKAKFTALTYEWSSPPPRERRSAPSHRHQPSADHSTET